MRTQIKNILKKAYAILMITLIGMMVYNQAAYLHTHQVNGNKVSHAHPYNKTSDKAPIKSHNHSTFEFATLNSINILFLSLFIVLSILFGIKLTNRFVPTLSSYFPPLHLSSQGRAPPVFQH